jgi:hypothetical protein
MAEPHWTSYVGMGTGIVGLILSVVSYRRTNNIRELELRLQLRKAANKALLDLATLKELLPSARRSHDHVAAARGMFRSGAMVLWREKYQEDEAKLKALVEASLATSDDFASLDLKALETKSADVHKLQLEIQQLTDKYRGTLAADDAEREQIRADIRNLRT